MINDADSLTQLEQIAAGRTHKQMVYLSHLAHEKIARDAERSKHAALKAALNSTTVLAAMATSSSTADWGALKGYLLDGQGSHLADISLGLAVAAVLDDKPDEAEYQIRAVFKSLLLGLPHVLQQALSQRMPAPVPTGGKT